MSIPLLVAVLMIVLGWACYVAGPDEWQVKEVGRASLWVGMLLLGLMLTGRGL